MIDIIIGCHVLVQKAVELGRLESLLADHALVDLGPPSIIKVKVVLVSSQLAVVDEYLGLLVGLADGSRRIKLLLDSVLSIEWSSFVVP